MIVAGVGCRRGAPAGDIEAAIRAALAHANVSADALGAVATIAAKSTEQGVKAAADKFGVAVVPVSETEIKAVSDRIETRSARVLALVGVPAVAEGAALAAAGPAAHLICPRLAIGAATCALAITGAAT
jgi:cobalt-precorrin 5A hydrolase